MPSMMEWLNFTDFWSILISILTATLGAIMLSISEKKF